MPAPFMVDSAKGYSEDIVMDITEEDGRYILRLTPDKEWLNAEERVYPVTIDPTVSPANVSSNVRDTYIYTGDSTKHNNETTMYMGLRNNKVHRTFIKYTTMPTINGSITGATIKLTVTPTTSTYGPIAAYKVNSNWDSATITWANQPTSLTYLSSMSRSGTVLSFNVIGAVKNWYSGSSTGSTGNYGFAIKYTNETYKDYNRVYTAESSENRPVLNITYVPSTAIAISIDGSQIMVGQTKQINYSSSGYSISWKSSDTDVATVSSSGVITGISEGSAKITATFKSSDGETYTNSVSVDVRNSYGIVENEEYYIMNCSSERYLSLQLATDANNDNVYTRQRGTTKLNQWRVRKIGNEKYEFVSVYSPTSKVLNVTGTNLDIYTYMNAPAQRFDIMRIDSGTYQGMYYIKYGKYYVTQDTNYNVYLTTTASSASVWSFMRVDKRSADLYNFNYPLDGKYFDTTDNDEAFERIIEMAGYSWDIGTNPSVEKIYDTLTNEDDILMYDGHGNAGQIVSYGDDGNIKGVLAVNQTVCRLNGISGSIEQKYVEDIEENGLASLRVILLMSCETNWECGGYNLLETIYDKGAHFVLGTDERALTDQCDLFIGGFLEGIENRENIELCVERGKTKSKEYKVMGNASEPIAVVYLGDKYQYLR